MINLALVKNCPSVITQASFELPYPIITDTRKYAHPAAFVAIPGERVNPLDMIDSLLDQRCPVVFYQQDDVNDKKVAALKNKYSKTQFIAVSDSVVFLQEIAHEHIKEWKTKSPKHTVFSISGSNGKTTHKEMLSHILKTILPGKVIATEKNNNNHLGVPLTLLGVKEQTEIVVLELGSNHPGEIKVLCDIALPNAGLTTNIGATHLEFFGTEEKVFDEEAYLFYAVKAVTGGKGFFLQNVDDRFLKTLPQTAGTIPYGEGSQAQAKVSFTESGAEMNYQGKKFSVHNESITGKHNKLNLITCSFIAHHFFPELSLEIGKAASTFAPTRNRSEWIEFEDRSVFLDAYNANPSSMKAALEGFKESVIQRGFTLAEACVVLGDMNELGDSSPEYHREVGKFVEDLGFTNAYFVGRFSKYYQETCPVGQTRSSSAEFKSEYRSECLKKFPIHFIKGSRSLQLESLFDIT
jgi:UDP-N-acetylmuramoyl-tripeptide--D-alanyl-D-alanine ligase